MTINTQKEVKMDIIKGLWKTTIWWRRGSGSS